MTKVTLDQSPAAVGRRRAEVDRRMSGVDAKGDARNEVRRRITSEVEAEDLKATEAAAAQAEAASERGRIASIIAAGVDCGRPRQALRLALAGPVGADQAKSILSGLTLDQDAPAAALALPDAGTFGSEAAQQERRRIGSVFAHPAASGRFKSACALALHGAEPIPASAIADMLAGLPIEQTAPRVLTLEEREKGLSSFGDDTETAQGRTKGEKIAAGWSRAVSSANASLGVQSEDKRPSGAAMSVDEDEEFGTVDALPEGAK